MTVEVLENDHMARPPVAWSDNSNLPKRNKIANEISHKARKNLLRNEESHKKESKYVKIGIVFNE